MIIAFTKAGKRYKKHNHRFTTSANRTNGIEGFLSGLALLGFVSDKRNVFKKYQQRSAILFSSFVANLIVSSMILQDKVRALMVRETSRMYIHLLRSLSAVLFLFPLK